MTHMEYEDYNHDQERRDELLGISDVANWRGGICRYSGVDISTLEILLEEKYIGPEERQNDSPTVGEFIEFMRKYPRALAHGYAVHKDRNDYRVSIEGLEVAECDATEEMALDFVDLCRDADDFDIRGGLYCWYD